jgi:hypothetical protein
MRLRGRFLRKRRGLAAYRFPIRLYLARCHLLSDSYRDRIKPDVLSIAMTTMQHIYATDKVHQTAQTHRHPS